MSMLNNGIKNKQSQNKVFNKYNEAVQEIDKLLKNEQTNFQELGEDSAKKTKLKEIIIEKEKIEKELQDSEERYRTIFENSAIAITLVDEYERIISWNKYTEKLLCMNKEDLFLKPVSILYPSEEWKKIRTENIRQKGMQHHLETKIIGKNNNYIDVDLSLSVLKNNEGKVIGSIGVIRDISEYKKMEYELRNTQKKLEIRVEERTAELSKINRLLKNKIIERNRATSKLKKTMDNLKKSQERIEKQNIQLIKLNKIKSDFLNVTSHELRTPMASIKGYVQMLLKNNLGNINNEQRKSLEVVLRNINRLDNLIQDILDISRLESGTMKFITKKTNIKQIVIETVETMHSSAILKDIKINIDIENKLPDIIIDFERIKQVIVNLLHNAIKFSPKKSIINIKLKRNKCDILFEIQDFGRGIPRNKQNRIFNTFYQVDSGMDRKFGGAGLGLAICRGIIMAHGGKIWVESIVGEGSSFKFTLPLQPIKDVESKFKEVKIFKLDNKT